MGFIRKKGMTAVIFFMIAAIIMICLPGTEKAAADSDAAAYINFETGDSYGMRLVEDNNTNAEAYTKESEISGITCREIPSSKFMYIEFDKDVIPEDTKEAIITVTYYGNNSNSLWFNYNSDESDYHIADFQKVNTDSWVTATVTIENASFRGRMNQGADIRLGFNGSNNYIRSITLSFGKLDPDNEPVPEKPENPSSEFKGKSFAGYQVWHRAGNEPGDWVHWSYGKIAGPGLQDNVNINSFPYLADYPDDVLYDTNFDVLGNGSPTRLYSSADPKVIKQQFDWISEAGLDGVAIQRFVGGIGKTIQETDISHLTTIKEAAERTGVLFYICYDLNGAGNDILECFKKDWVYEIEQMRALTSSPNYATVDGKPVVEIWGVGYDFITVPEKMLSIIEFFHERGCYVIGGTPRDFRDKHAGTAYEEVYKALDCISPWTVGVYSDSEGADRYYQETMIKDYAYCTQYGTDYLPVCFAGSGNWVVNDTTISEVDREGGNLLWTQVRNAKELGLNAVYFAMLDEFEENTQLINAAVDYFDIPTDEYFETLSKDGIWVSPDYYLRLAATAAKLLRDEMPNTEAVPISYSNGPVYFRNSFESRTTTFRRDSYAVKDKTMTIDPCFYHNITLKDTGISDAVSEIIKDTASSRSGDYVLSVKGNAGEDAEYVYQINEVKIMVSSGMELHYSRHAFNEYGMQTVIDLIFEDGSYLSGTPFYETIISEDDDYQDVIVSFGKEDLIGRTIVGIAVRYAGSPGSFLVYFDDIMIADAGIRITRAEKPLYVEPEDESSLEETGFIEEAGQQEDDGSSDMDLLPEESENIIDINESGGSINANDNGTQNKIWSYAAFIVIILTAGGVIMLTFIRKKRYK